MTEQTQTHHAMQLELDSTLFIAKGRDRACYRHPLEPSLCIKVALRPEKQSVREKAYFEFLRKRDTDTTALCTYQGMAETNLGKGHLFELARNQDGTLAPTLKRAIESRQIKKSHLQTKLPAFKRYLTDNRICVKDLSPSNLACQFDAHGDFTLSLIDGIGSPNLNPATIRSDYLTRRAIETAWKRLERKINQLYDPSTPRPFKLPRRIKNWLVAMGATLSASGGILYLLIEE